MKKVLISLIAVMLVFSGFAQSSYGESRFNLGGMIYLTNQDELETICQSDGLYMITESFDIDRDITITGDGYVTVGSRDNQTIVNIKNGATLTINADHLSLMINGNSTLINVEDGGKLVLEKGIIESVIGDPSVPGINIEEGGKCILYSNYYINTANLYEGYSRESFFAGEITGADSEEGSEPETDPETGGDSSYPGIGSGGTSIRISGEAVQVNPLNNVNIYITMPALTEDIEKITVQTYELSDEKAFWKDSAVYENKCKNGTILFARDAGDGREIYAWNSLNDEMGFVNFVNEWTEENKEKEVLFRVVLQYADRTAESGAASVIMPASGAVTNNTIDEKYGDIGGNRGGMGQGESDRVPPEEVTPPGPVIPDWFIPPLYPDINVNPEPEIPDETEKDNESGETALPEGDNNDSETGNEEAVKPLPGGNVEKPVDKNKENHDIKGNPDRESYEKIYDLFPEKITGESVFAGETSEVNVSKGENSEGRPVASVNDGTTEKQASDSMYRKKDSENRSEGHGLLMSLAATVAVVASVSVISAFIKKRR